MKLAFISTINSLDKISILGDIDFCLAPYLKYKRYKEYFKKSKKYIIIDHGVAEDMRIPAKTYVNRAISIGANEIIVPDKIGDYRESMKLKEQFLSKFYSVLKKNNIKIMGVVQGKTIHEYMQYLLELEKDKRIDVIGVPFRMNYAKFNNTTKDENHALNRLMFLFATMPISKPIHLLGSNLPYELVTVIEAHIHNVRSCDSKLMARYGLNNKIWKYSDRRKPKKKLYITDKLSDEQISCAITNIKKIQEVIQNDR